MGTWTGVLPWMGTGTKTSLQTKTTYYEAGEWLKDIYFSADNWSDGAPPGFTCYE